MKRYILLLALLAACQPAEKSADIPVSDEGAAAVVIVQEDMVMLRLNMPISEPRACIIPIQVENGLDASTSVSMIGFDLTGPGEDAKGNMFAPIAPPGAMSEARVIVQGQSCDAFDTISVLEIRCTSGDEMCTEKIKFTDGETLRFSTAG